MRFTSAQLVGLLLLAGCSQQPDREVSSNLESKRAALGVVPPSESAVWKRYLSSMMPGERYLQAAVFDENRKVVVMFGGANLDKDARAVVPNQETWEWNPTTGKWTNRTGTGEKPSARSGAAMVFDSERGKVMLFGGRAANNQDLADLWEWNPADGAWTSVSPVGELPSARNQHGMVYQKSAKTILLFGGGNSDPESLDATGMTKSLGDTWEYDPATKIWAKRAPSVSPSIRHDFGLVWDDSRNRAVLFAGLQTDVVGILGIPKQDTWDWDPATGTWTERTAPDLKPSVRFAQGMAFDSVRKKVVVFGGMDINTGLGLNDLWEWDAPTATWQKRLTGEEAGIPSKRIFASLVAIGTRMQLVAGAIDSRWSTGKETGNVLFFELAGIREVWELDPAALTFTDRSPVVDVPSARDNPAMAYSPATGKTYLFGGQSSGNYLDDLWAWDGNGWTPIVTDVRPSPRYYAAMAYDPVRKSLILFGGFWSGLVGSGADITFLRTVLDDTWELGADGKWTELHPASKPLPTQAHTMATDTVRNKVLLYGGAGTEQPIPGVPDTGFFRNHVWEWDGSTMTWTDRSPPAATDYPYTVWTPSMTYDDLRQKLVVLELTSDRADNTWFWEWDAISAGWSKRQIGEAPGNGDALRVVNDPVRKREVVYTDARDPSGKQETWEIDSQGPAWYVRTFAEAPGARIEARVAFDSKRGVVVFYGGTSKSSNETMNDTWEYAVTNLGSGEGCAAATASTCASGFCVDGVCCDVAACTGACKSCNVPGAVGTCTMVKAGTEVAGSCSAGQACDGNGSCLAKNGQACTSGSTCASGFCADGVCCDGACTGACVACNQAGQEGTCRPYAAGTDPQSQCSGGAGACKATCDGAGSCAFPQKYTICGTCLTCDGKGSCSTFDSVCGAGGAGGYGGGTTKPYDTGGIGGSSSKVGGAGGSVGRGGAGGAGGGSSTGGSEDGGGGRDSGSAGDQAGGAGGQTAGGGGASAIAGSGGASTIVGSGGTSAISGTGGASVITGSGGITSAGGIGGGTSAGTGGATGPVDAGVSDAAAPVQLNKGGCSCGLGGGGRDRAIPSLLVLLAGALFVSRRSGRRRHSTRQRQPADVDLRPLLPRPRGRRLGLGAATKRRSRAAPLTRPGTAQVGVATVWQPWCRPRYYRRNGT